MHAVRYATSFVLFRENVFYQIKIFRRYIFLFRCFKHPFAMKNILSTTLFYRIYFFIEAPPLKQACHRNSLPCDEIVTSLSSERHKLVTRLSQACHFLSQACDKGGASLKNTFAYNSFSIIYKCVFLTQVLG